MRKLRTLIVDDERLARQRVRRLLLGEADVEVVGECVNAREARAAVQATSPQLLFLDVQTPQGDGFHVLEVFQGSPALAVIFVTAYEQYAVRAFEVRAQEYLLKPIDEWRFRGAVQRAR